MKFISIAAIAAMALIALCGCTVKSEVAEESKNKMVHCKDTRDGEEFTFNTNNVTNVRAGYGGAPSSIDFVDTEGRKRHHSGDDSFMKCEVVDK